ncbi:hypothetical protein FGO68_gene4820 [Halteria grandinella]|uniref:Uncharacterized protein n=1 Tax=Halteria grandinella TaxID=5974 RepID=A0A8J8T6H1_HALGN|nr:hypothetical protein FGO68_gene4820 [Halteria grandinella]
MLDGERPKYKRLYNMCSVSGLVMNGVFIVTLPSGMHKALFGVNQCAVFITGVTLCGVIPAFFIDEELRKQQMTMFYKFFKKIETLKKRSRSMSNASPGGGFNQSPGGGGRTSMVIRKFEIEQQQPGEFQLQIRKFEQGSEIIEEESEQSDGQSEQSEQQRKRKMLNPEEIVQSARKSKRSMQTSQRLCSMTARVYLKWQQERGQEKCQSCDPYYPHLRCGRVCSIQAFFASEQRHALSQSSIPGRCGLFT